MERLHFVLTFAAAMGCALVAGVFFAFSSFVMRALARIPAAGGILAMQSINVVVINPWFMGLFLGTGVVCAALGVWTIAGWERAGSAYALAGSVAYLVGTFGVTMACNVPRNSLLARVEPESAEAERVWAEYVKGWTAWNTVRTVAAAVAAGCFTIALVAAHR